ncbi:VCBS repeat-containing protein [Nonomuraea sp. B10E15]|uniref:FG-GAP repeat domain-containing protein n=1 Tax=Nonomuraea sp. B10E15 TaxID=3153560 RepID=UPI00325E1A45
MARKLGVLLVSLALTGCAASGPATSRPSPSPPVPPPVPSPGASSPAASAPAASSPVVASPVAVTPAASPPAPPRCAGDAEPGDLNGDGYADLAFVWTGATGQSLERGQLVVVHGSARGLDPSTAYVAGEANMTGEVLPQLADLDGDGCADVVIPDRSLSIFWSGLGPATVLPYGSRSGLADLDGDDAIDILAARSREGDTDGSPLVLLHGPFTRSGGPAREASRPLPEGEWPGRLVTDPRGSGAVLYGPDDGEQADAWLLTGEAFREVATGSAAVFGDFDGDGRRDVAIGDSGARNNEPGSDTEAPSVDGITRVFYGRDREPQILTGLRGSLACGDLNGDGRDDLVSGEVTGKNAVITGKAEILTGSPQGLRRPGLVTTHGGPDRASAGKPLKEWQRGAVKTWALADYDGDGKDELLRVWRGGLDLARFWRLDAGGRTRQTFDLGGSEAEGRNREMGVRQ